MTNGERVLYYSAGKIRERSNCMLRNILIFCIPAVTVLLLVSCSSKPDYNEDNVISIETYFEKEENRVKETKWFEEGSIYADYINTKLDMRDNRDVSASVGEGSHHTPFVTRYDPNTKVNVGPGHVPYKTRWCSICNAEVSNSEQEPHRHYKDKDGKDRHTRYSYGTNREVGWNYAFKKTKFLPSAGREVDEELHVPGVTRWDPVYDEEVGPGFDRGLTKFCPTCEADVALFGHEFKSAIHYGHACDTTSYSLVWMVDMFRKERRIYEKIPASKTDYIELDQDFAPDSQPRIYVPKPPEENPLTMPEVKWVEDRAVRLDRDLIETYRRLVKHYKDTQNRELWWWKDEKYAKITFKLAERRVIDVAGDARTLTENAKDPDYDWEKEKGKIDDE